MYLILETSTCDEWPLLKAHDPLVIGAVRIPAHRRPTVMQPDLATAEQEAIRLAKAHPGCTFVVFKAAVAGISKQTPTHITLGGRVVPTQTEGRLVDIRDLDVTPF